MYMYQDSCASIKGSWYVHTCTAVGSIVMWSWQFSIIFWYTHALIELWTVQWAMSECDFSHLGSPTGDTSESRFNGHICSYLAGECWLYCALVPTEHQPPSTQKSGALSVAQPEPPQPTQPLQQHAELQSKAATIGRKCAVLQFG